MMMVATVLSRLMQVQRMLFERFKRREIEDAFMGRLEHDARRHASLPRLDPAKHVQAPAIARLQAPEPKIRPRSDQIIAALARKLEKLCRHLDANEMCDAILAASAAAPIPKESGQRIKAAGKQRSAEHIFFLGKFIAHGL